MSDLVERLRQHGCPVPHEKWPLAVDCVAANRCGCDEKDAVEAAAEIASLRKANALLLETMAKQDAEVGRLRAALEEIALDAPKWARKIAMEALGK